MFTGFGSGFGIFEGRPHGGAPGGRGAFFDPFGRPVFHLDVVRVSSAGMRE